MIEPDFLQATLPLFEQDQVDLLEWSVDLGWGPSGVPAWAAGLLDEFGQREPSQLRMKLQEAIKAQQSLLFGTIAITEDAHVCDMLIHHYSKETSETRKSSLFLERRVAVFTDEGSHDRCGARTILLM